jgi:hypothetical protein
VSALNVDVLRRATAASERVVLQRQIKVEPAALIAAEESCA